MTGIETFCKHQIDTKALNWFPQARARCLRGKEQEELNEIKSLEKTTEKLYGNVEKMKMEMSDFKETLEAMKKKI